MQSWDQLDLELQTTCHFTPEKKFPLWTACNYSHLLIPWIFGPSVQLLHLLLTHLVWWTSLSKPLEHRFYTYFWVLFTPTVLTTSVSITQPSSILTLALIVTQWTCPNPLPQKKRNGQTQDSNNCSVTTQSIYSLWTRWVCLSRVWVLYHYYVFMLLCVVSGLLPLKTVSPWCALYKYIENIFII